MRTLRRLITIAMLVIAASALEAGPLFANHSGQVAAFVPFDGSFFFNYDGKPDTSRNTRDWPITLIFYDQASIDKVKIMMAESYSKKGSTEWEPYQLHPNKTRFDADKGKKTPCDDKGKDSHFRVYAPSGSGVPRQDRFFGRGWGFFIVGSTHFDFGDGDGCPGHRQFGYSERAENRVAKYGDLVGMRLTPDYLRLYNREPFRRTKKHPNHIWQNNGKASVLAVR